MWIFLCEFQFQYFEHYFIKNKLLKMINKNLHHKSESRRKEWVINKLTNYENIIAKILMVLFNLWQVQSFFSSILSLNFLNGFNGFFVFMLCAKAHLITGRNKHTIFIDLHRNNFYVSRNAPEIALDILYVFATERAIK